MSELILNEETHTYTLDGIEVMGVTKSLKIIDDRPPVEQWYLDRGKFVHLATELYDHDELDESSVAEEILPYLNAYRKFLMETDFRPSMIEFPLHHPQMKYAGKIDRIGTFNGVGVLVDLKTGPPAKVDPIQVAAYWELCRVNEIPIRKCFDLHLKADGNYSLREVEKPRLLLPIFQACLTLTRWRKEA